MKIILSRKGLDGDNGGCASPIMPDGTLLSIPIPSQNDNASYSDIEWNGHNYLDILNQLNPKKEYNKCHLDPDIRDNRINKIPNWNPAFGQVKGAQGQLNKVGIEPGDIFLFFGWFRGVEKTANGYKYRKRNPNDFYSGNDLQVIFGYMQIGEIITDQERIEDYYWHPHALKEYKGVANNTLYIPTERLSINPKLKGYGTLGFREDRVLTMRGKTRATWDEYSFLAPEHTAGNRKNSAKGDGLYYAGIWQELVVYESEELLDWVRRIIN